MNKPIIYPWIYIFLVIAYISVIVVIVGASSLAAMRKEFSAPDKPSNTVANLPESQSNRAYKFIRHLKKLSNYILLLLSLMILLEVIVFVLHAT